MYPCRESHLRECWTCHRPMGTSANSSPLTLHYYQHYNFKSPYYFNQNNLADYWLHCSDNLTIESHQISTLSSLEQRPEIQGSKIANRGTSLAEECRHWSFSCYLFQSHSSKVACTLGQSSMHYKFSYSLSLQPSVILQSYNLNRPRPPLHVMETISGVLKPVNRSLMSNRWGKASSCQLIFPSVQKSALFAEMPQSPQ